MKILKKIKTFLNSDLTTFLIVYFFPVILFMLLGIMFAVFASIVHEIENKQFFITNSLICIATTLIINAIKSKK